MASVTISGNLSQTARELGVSLSALLAANPQLSNPNIIRAGTQLRVPGRDNLSPAESATQLARVFSNPLGSGQLPNVNWYGAAPPNAPQTAAGGGTTPAASASVYQDRYDQMNAGAPVLGQAFAREGAALTPQGTVSTAALRTTAPYVSPYGRTGPTRSAVGPTSTVPTPAETIIGRGLGGLGGAVTGGVAAIYGTLAEMASRRGTAEASTNPVVDLVSNLRQNLFTGILGGALQGADAGQASMLTARGGALPGGSSIQTPEQAQRVDTVIAAAGGPVTGGRGSQGSRGRLDTITPAWQMARELLNAANEGDLTLRPSYLTTGWAMEIRNLWDRLAPGVTTLSEFMNGIGYQQVPGSTKWVRMDEPTLSGGLGGGGFGGGGGSGGGRGGGGGGGGFSSGRASGDSALYNWGIRITV